MLGKVILLVILILINGVFVASEIAFLSLNKFTLKNKGKRKNKKAIKIEKMINEPSRFLATIQIGITLAGFLASAFAAESFADAIVKNQIFSAMNYEVAKTIVVIIVTIILSYFTLVFGELVPKRIALAYPEKIAFLTVNLIDIIMKGTYPFVWLLTKSTEFVSKLFRIKSKEGDKITEEEIKKMLISAKDEGAIESGEKKLIFNIFEFNDTTAKEIMTKKSKIIMIDVKASQKDLLKTIKESKFTRIPVYENSENNIIGTLNVKNLIYQYSKTSKFDIREIMYEPFFIEPDEKVDDVFREMQRKRKAIAIVKSKEKTLGLVTLEDAIEEVLGNIYDEFD